MLGPPLGSFIYGYLGFAWTFWVFSAFIMGNLGMLFVYLPNQLNYDKDSLVESRKTIEELAIFEG